MKLRYILTLTFISVLISGCTLGSVINDYQWENATPRAKQKREAYYEVQCRANPATSIQKKLKDGYGVLYVYAYGCKHCSLYMFPRDDGFVTNIEIPNYDYTQKEIYINGELASKLNTWNFTIFYLKAGKYNVVYKTINESVKADIEIAPGKPTIFYTTDELTPSIKQGKENFTGFYERVLYGRGALFIFKMPDDERYAKGAKEYLDISTCDRTNERWKIQN